MLMFRPFDEQQLELLVRTEQQCDRRFAPVPVPLDASGRPVLQDLVQDTKSRVHALD
jgi:hypothetical protein